MSPTPPSFPANAPAADAQDDPALNASRQARGLAHDLNNVLTSMLSAVNHLRSHLHRGRGEMVLLVDDDPSVLAICKAALQQFGYQVVTSEDGRAAVAAFSEHRKDMQAVVTDLCMPAMDGGQVATAVLRMKPTVKVIISSGYLDDAERDRLGGLGVHGFLAKPYRSAQLLQMLKETLASARSAR